jgi:translation initiation factor IF-2
MEEALEPPQSITLSGPVIVSDLADMLRVSPTEVIKRLLAEGVMAAINQQIDVEQASAVAEHLGIAVDAPAASEAAPSPVDRETVGRLLAHDNPERRAQRPPIVAILGHVDHGKTTLLDAIRSTRVAEGEAGGITQHIGAYVVRHGERQITFLDTPGHEAFTAMRARGAQVTDIAVLVVAADDGVMPQTLEAISHARAANVPIVVAMNKIDRPNANPDRVMQQLTEHGLQPEAWGGDTIVVPVSALRHEGIPELLDMLLLVADIQELRADPDRPAVGTIVEAEVTRGRGPVATVLVQSGTLRVGDSFVAGQVFGRVRAMVNDLGRAVQEAGASTPVEVLGFTEVPEAGDPFQVLAEREARTLAAARQSTARQQSVAAGRAQSLADFRGDGEGERIADLRVILKADVQGSLEAVRGSLEKLHNDEARVVLLHAGVGPVTESDIMLGSASGAVILGFNVRPDAGAEREAQRVGVEIKTYRIIYELLDDVQKALDGLLKPRFETVTIGHVEVRKTIRVPDVGIIAGAYVTDGLVRRGAACRVVRNGTIVHEGVIASLRRFKDDAREVAGGFECGVGFDRWNDVKEGDTVEVLEEREVAR